MKSIILFDKQDITRLGMEALITELYQNEAIYRISLTDTKTALVKALISNPDSIVVLDYALSDLNGVNTLLNISARFPETRWVLFSDELSVQFLKKVVCNDAFSVALKSAELSEIKMAISFAGNETPFIASQVKELLSLSNKNNTGIDEVLTLTEKEILREIASGKTTNEIADTRNISRHTVITHRKNIYRKLEVNNAQEATRYALRAGILDSSDYFI